MVNNINMKCPSKRNSTTLTKMGEGKGSVISFRPSAGNDIKLRLMAKVNNMSIGELINKLIEDALNESNKN